jgi:hypothetical protein
LSVNLLPYYDKLGLYYGYGLYNSFIGTDALNYVKDVQTMNLIFDPGQPEGPDTRWVILHEFGHALGFIHEHQRPDRPIAWEKTALEAYASQRWGWDASMVKEQILDEYPDGNLAGTAFDVRSVMMYKYPSGLALYKDDGRPFESRVNPELSALDKVAAATAYPKRAAVLAVVELTLDKPVPAAVDVGQVARFWFTTAEAGSYRLATRPGMPALLALLRKVNPPDGRGLPGNILAAAESRDDRTGASLSLELAAGTKFYIEVRHAEPMRGKGEFSLTLARKGP